MKFLVAIVLLGIASVYAAPLPSNFDVDSNLGFLEGDYILIGRKPDSKETFTGTVTLTRNKDKLDVVRVVAGQTTYGVAFYDAITPDQIVVLRMKFTGDADKLSAVYMCSADPDNYARITGYLYDGDTKSPGLEALFPAASLPEAGEDAAATP
jgi:hypothetical protein